MDGTGQLFYRQVPLLARSYRVVTYALRDTAVTMDVLIADLARVIDTVAPIGLSGPERSRRATWIGRFKPLHSSVEFIQKADARLIRNPHLLIEASALQVGIILLDSATMWVLLRSLGTYPPVAGVFASFMIASLVRT